jgi:hypothetical protein
VCLFFFNGLIPGSVVNGCNDTQKYIGTQHKVKGPQYIPFSNNTTRHHRGTPLFKTKHRTKSHCSPVQCHHGHRATYEGLERIYSTSLSKKGYDVIISPMYLARVRVFHEFGKYVMSLETVPSFVIKFPVTRNSNMTDAVQSIVEWIKSLQTKKDRHKSVWCHKPHIFS